MWSLQTDAYDAEQQRDLRGAASHNSRGDYHCWIAVRNTPWLYSEVKANGLLCALK